mmetsp:Transcript_22885/g.58864  ORF Transcript_22885/g.58864 Transcript_22885/m.58864 type:complete len:147 (+) Transcript_22885:131-571(+)
MEDTLDEELDRAAAEMEEEEWLRRRREAEVRKGPLIEHLLREAELGRPEMLNRYEFARRTSFKPSSMKKLMTELSGTAVDDDAVIIMRGIAKVFAAELIEAASDVREEAAPESVVQPHHVREALHRLQRESAIPPLRKYRRRRFWR